MHKTCVMHDVCAVYAYQQLLTSFDASTCMQACRHAFSQYCMQAILSPPVSPVYDH